MEIVQNLISDSEMATLGASTESRHFEVCIVFPADKNCKDPENFLTTPFLMGDEKDPNRDTEHDIPSGMDMYRAIREKFGSEYCKAIPGITLLLKWDV